MNEAVFLSLFILLLGAGTGWVIYWSGPKFAGWGHKRAVLTGGGIALGSLVAAIFAYTTSMAIDSTTLFEARLPANIETKEGDPVITHSMQFVVEHPGTRHTLMLSPRDDSVSQLSTVSVNLRLWERRDQPLLDMNTRFEPERKQYRDRDGGSYYRWEWDSASYEFTPAEAGLHNLEVDFLNVGMPAFYLRVEDPLKTDGTRDSSLR